jgi:cell division protein FtsQ
VSTALALIPPPALAMARKAANWGLLLGALALVGAGFVAMKLPQMIGVEIGEAVGKAGFSVERIEITGIRHMDRDQVLAAAVNEQSRAMPLVDLAGIRGRLMQLGWVAEARVSRRLPDTLVIDIVERRPAAIWQYQQRLALIDAQGRLIERVKLTGAPLPDLPIVIGPNANYQIASLRALLQSAPALEPMLDGATWVGERRWDIRFRSGETLSLPEGEREARAALLRFASEDGKARLLGQGVIRFDMRVPGKMVVRVPSAAVRKSQAEEQQRTRDDVANDPAAQENT